MTPTTVANIRDGTYDPANPDHLYIGRPVRRSPYAAVRRGSKFANPFAVGRDGTREQCIEQFRRYLLRHSDHGCA